jgi:uncharacterized protein YraI
MFTHSKTDTYTLNKYTDTRRTTMSVTEKGTRFMEKMHHIMPLLGLLCLIALALTVLETAGPVRAEITAPQGAIGDGRSNPAATVTTDYVPLRGGPGPATGIVEQLRAGQDVMLLGRNADTTWLNVAVLPGELQGWLDATAVQTNADLMALRVIGETPTDGCSSAPTALVRAYSLNIRQGPGTSHAVIGWLRGGETVVLSGYRNAAGTWVQVPLNDGREGWVSAAYLQSDFPLANLAVAGDAQSPTLRTHVVQRGENLFRIALRYEVTIEALAVTNGIAYPWTIYAGQTLLIP